MRVSINRSSIRLAWRASEVPMVLGDRAQIVITKIERGAPNMVLAGRVTSYVVKVMVGGPTVEGLTVSHVHRQDEVLVLTRGMSDTQMKFDVGPMPRMSGSEARVSGWSEDNTAFYLTVDRAVENDRPVQTRKPRSKPKHADEQLALANAFEGDEPSGEDDGDRPWRDDRTSLPPTSIGDIEQLVMRANLMVREMRGRLVFEMIENRLSATVRL